MSSFNILDLTPFGEGGCIQAATKNTIKTAKIKFNDKNVKATAAVKSRLRNDDKRAAAEDKTTNNNKQSNKDPSNSVWPINVKSYKITNNENKNIKIITKTKNKKYKQSLNLSLVLLITMTVLMTILQMPHETTAATIVRVKDTRHQLATHHSSGSSKTNNENDSDDGDGDDNNESESSNHSNLSSRSHSSDSIEDIIKIVVKNSGGSRNHDSHNLERTRKIKRHSDDFYLLHHQEESLTNLEWVNPCSGVFELSEEKNSMQPPPSYYLKKLRQVLGGEFHNINDTMNTIDISDMGTWSKYRRHFSFLPKINLDSNIALKRWYRHMQTYVATFAYLGRTQLKWDRTKHNSISPLTHELDQLLVSARSILCEIETTINGSYPYPNNKPKLMTITREVMNKKLRFLTKRHQNSDQEAIEPEILDLQFAKSKYYHYLRRMWRVIRMRTKRNGQKHLVLGTSNESSASAASVSATLEDFLGSVANDLSSRSSSSSSASESFEYSKEKKSKRNRRPKQHRQRKLSQKSAELPQL